MNKEQIDLVLETLSFYETMSFERILFDFDLEKVTKMKEFTKEDLEAILKKLVKEKKIKKIKIGKSVEYIRLYPEKSTWRKFLSFIKFYE